ncbi:MAG: hypothetical protein LBP56_02345 [Odoribacteraceae bacterium]|jgi:hypothetical protein|nr:hypothetical protein [Odoribacteraceae bacterium]
MKTISLFTTVVRLLALVTVGLSLPWPAAAQTREQDRIHLEAGSGIRFEGSNKEKKQGRIAGTALYVEARYQLRDIPIDVGVQEIVTNINTSTILTGLLTGSLPTRTLVIADYKFFHERAIVPFIGLGIGSDIGWLIGWSSSRGLLYDFSAGLNAMPRVGIRFRHGFSIIVDYEVSTMKYSHLELKIGYFL